MSYNNHYSGVITITPPVTAAAAIRDVPKTEDARLRVSRAVTPTGQGEIIVLTADAIEATCDGFSGYDLVKDIQALVDHVGPGHEFGGYIEVQWDPGFREPPSRYVVRGGKVETLTPQLVWPSAVREYRVLPGTEDPEVVLTGPCAETIGCLFQRAYGEAGVTLGTLLDAALEHEGEQGEQAHARIAELAAEWDAHAEARNAGIDGEPPAGGQQP